MAIAQIETKNMIKAYDDLFLTRPKGFMKSLFKTPPENIKNTFQIELDVIRAGKRIAIDVVLGTGPNMNKSGRFTTKLFTPPGYNEADAVSVMEMFNRLPGETPYEERKANARIMAKIVRKQIELTWMIERAWENQAAQALTTGKITLTNAINGSVEIDFGLRGSHSVSASASWGTAGTDIIGDIIAMGLEIREDSHYIPDMLITRGNVIEDILNNDVIKGRLEQIKSSREAFVAPSFIGTGGVFHGFISAGDLRIQLWSYDETYDTSAVANNYYIPDDTVVLLASKARFDAVFAGVPVLIPANKNAAAKALGLPAFPSIASGLIVPSYQIDWKGKTVVAEVSSRPIMIPTTIDAFGIIDVA